MRLISLVKPSIERIIEAYGLPQSYAGDRGFYSATNHVDLDELHVMNAICPRSIPQLQEQLQATIAEAA